MVCSIQLRVRLEADPVRFVDTAQSNKGVQMTRLPDLRVADLNERQRAIYKIIDRGPREFVQGPIRALLLSPDLAENVQTFGSYVHYGRCFEPRLMELAVLITARAWTCQYEWYIHAPLAEKRGLSASIIEAIRVRTEPKFEREDEAALYRFSRELLNNHRVSETTYEQAVRVFGESSVANLVGLLGYFVVLSMTINGFELGLPSGKSPPLSD